MPRKLETDRWLFLVTLALCLIGAVMVFSASAVTAREQYGNGYYFLLRQLVWLALGLAGMFALMNVDYRRLRRAALRFHVPVPVSAHARRRVFPRQVSRHASLVRIGPASLQPSELAKLAVILFLAWLLEMRRRPRSFGVNDVRHTLLPAAGFVLLMLGLVLLEPDLGTALEIFLIALRPCCSSPAFRRNISSAAGAVAVPGSLHGHRARLLSLRARHGLPASRCRPARPRLPADAIADRRGLGRLHRRRPDGEQAEALLSSRGAHRFHFRRALRGARLHRRRHRSGAVRRLRLARPARRLSRPR